MNTTVMSTPTFHSTTGIVQYVIFKKLSIIDDEKTKEITIQNYVNLHKL
jgi:hypothetical protein